MTSSTRQAVIVSYARTGLAKAARGGFNITPMWHPLRLAEDFAAVDVLTTEPGMQLYSGNLLGGHVGKGGRRYPGRHGVCLETQHFADSPNQPRFPSTILRPGEELLSRTIYAFTVVP